METNPFDPTRYLQTEEDILYYLEAAMDENDNPALETLTSVLDALGLQLTVQKRAA